MPTSDARLHISLTEGSFVVSGSEEFVLQQIRTFDGAIQALLKKLGEGVVNGARAAESSNAATLPIAAEGPPTPDTSPAPADPSDKATPAGSYPNVFSISDDGIRINADLPGKASAEKMLAATLLYLLAKESTGEKRASFKEIQQVCRDHGCLDSSNFSKTIRAAKKDVNVFGTRGSLSAELTFPGRKAANLLAQQLNEE